MKKLLATLLALSLVLTSAAALAEEKTEIRYSKSQGPYTELFEAAIVPILEAQGYTLIAEETSDLLVADKILLQGDVDVNVEQHSAYIANFNANNANEETYLVAISPIPTVPAGIYSVNHATLDEIGEGMTIAVPNDASNTARCLLMLQKVGWIKLDPDVDVTAVTVDDIVENPYNLDFTEQKSLTIPAAIQDFDYVAITGSVVYNAGIDASTALANEDVLDHLVLQVTVKNTDADTEWAQAIVAAYHSDEFKAYLAENNNGLWWVPEELK